MYGSVGTAQELHYTTQEKSGLKPGVAAQKEDDGDIIYRQVTCRYARKYVY